VRGKRKKNEGRREKGEGRRRRGCHPDPERSKGEGSR
jgi:hypothetical protein